MTQKKILVFLGPSTTDLKSMHYALSLAERLKAQVIIFRSVNEMKNKDGMNQWVDDALTDLIAGARQNGFTVSFFISDRDIKEELIELIKSEHIDFMVMSAEETVGEALLYQLKSRVTVQIIQVKEKHQISFL